MNQWVGRAKRCGLAITAIIAMLCAAAPSRPVSAQTSAVSGPAAQAGSVADDSATELAKRLQNPVGDLISVPFQNNTNFGVGPHRGTQNVLNIEPVIPFHVNSEWNIITRTILPLVWNPSFAPASVPPFGTAPIAFSAFLSPAKPVDGWLWGAGPIIQLPTASNRALGSNVWGAGPTAVIVKMGGPVVAGLLVNNVSSFGGTTGPGGTRYNLTTVNPFFTYNFGEGWFLGSGPIATANWNSGGQKWTLPVGAHGGRLIKIADKLPVNLLVGAYYNVLRPTGVAPWQLRTQIAFIF